MPTYCFSHKQTLQIKMYNDGEVIPPIKKKKLLYLTFDAWTIKSSVVFSSYMYVGMPHIIQFIDFEYFSLLFHMPFTITVSSSLKKPSKMRPRISTGITGKGFPLGSLKQYKSNDITALPVFCPEFFIFHCAFIFCSIGQRLFML